MTTTNKESVLRYALAEWRKHFISVSNHNVVWTLNIPLDEVNDIFKQLENEHFGLNIMAEKQVIQVETRVSHP